MTPQFRVLYLLKTRTPLEMMEAAAAVEDLSYDVGVALSVFRGRGLTVGEAVEVCNTVTWNHRSEGWGLSYKDGGVYGYRYDGSPCAIDILYHKPTNIIVDCLGGSGEGLSPSAVWIVHGVNTNSARPWVAPIIPKSGVVTPIDPPKPPVTIHLDRDEFYAEMVELHRFYKADEGLKRKGGLASDDGTPDFTGIAAWIFDIYLNARLKGKTKDQAREEYRAEIRKSAEWIGHH